MHNVVKKIAEEHLGKIDSVERQETGICNEVYFVKSKEEEYVVRMNKDAKQMRGSSIFIPKLAALGITVPKIIAERYKDGPEGYAYQIMERLPGTDLGNVIETLTEQELELIAKEIAKIFQKLKSIPTNDTFGFVLDESGGEFSNWEKWVESNLENAIQNASNTGLLADIEHLIDPVQSIVKLYSNYFKEVPSVTYYADIAGKNVLIENGIFTGLVDLDALAYGDPLEAVGRIYTSWYGEKYGSFYSKAVMNALNLDNEQKKAVKMYALLHRFSWMCENGVVFNANTNGTINSEKAKSDTESVTQLLAELKQA